MATWTWVLIAVGIVVVVGLFAVALFSQRRTARLRRNFGPEYDREVQAREGRRRAEAELRGREKQRARIEIKPLPAQTRVRFVAEWRDLQERFVDQPSNAVVAADGLVTRLMGARGYPTDGFQAQATLISVDYPDVVDNYRHAHGVYDRAGSQQADTEDLRGAFLHYRLLFDRLVQVAATDDATEERVGGDGPQAWPARHAANESVPSESIPPPGHPGYAHDGSGR
jgi:hypothetical protein